MESQANASIGHGGDAKRMSMSTGTQTNKVVTPGAGNVSATVGKPILRTRPNPAVASHVDARSVVGGALIPERHVDERTKPAIDKTQRSELPMNGWNRGVAQLKYWLWLMLTKPLLAFIYIAIISDGLRTLVPAIGQKLYTLPFLADLKHYEMTYRLDLAPCFALFILIAVLHLWEKVLFVYLRSDKTALSSYWNVDNESLLVLVLGSVVLGADLILFYVGVTQMGWSGSGFSFSAVIATVAYVGVLIFVSYVSINLKHHK